MNEIKTIIEKYLAGNANADEQKGILKFIRSGKENQDFFYEIKSEWEKSRNKSFSLKEWEAWTKVKGRIDNSTKMLNVSKWKINAYKIASSVALLLLLTVVASTFILNRQKVFVSTRAGQNLNILLPDNSTIVLNSSSSLEYHPLLYAFSREVNLKGEAFFDIAKSKKPFKVKSDELYVRVLGTKFIVSAYDEYNKYRVVLEEGSVNLALESKCGWSLTLKPGQKADIDKGSLSCDVEHVNTLLYTSWTNGVLYFYDSPMSDLARNLELRYGINIQFDDPKIKEFIMSTTIRNESLEQVLDLIHKVLPVNIFTKHGRIVISLDEVRYKKYITKSKQSS